MTSSKKTTNRPVFERLRREHNIVFVDQLQQSQWPDTHRQVFEAVETLKGFKYSTYATTTTDQDDVPCKVDAKRQARKLVERSRDLVARNESTWRLACEPLVFSRLASEVACKSCRKRVWRSEVEASLNGYDRAAKNLQARQENRDRCRCPMTTRSHDEDETVGLNRLFIDRAEDTVMHPPGLAQQMPQEQRPDRIYGLRQTRNIEELLLKRLGDGIFLEDRLQKQPHSPLGEALLFPFLVVEAKAGNAPDDWHSIRLQTAFPIYTYLNTQQSLRMCSGQRSRWASGPLVWFFMSRGEDWRVCLAYQTPGASASSSSRPNHTTSIVQVWAGCITSRDDALQLFLIVDYMSDWARDIYRASVITELRILAAADVDVPSVFADTDIFSSYVVPAPASPSETDHTTAPAQDYGEVQTAFKLLDSPFGAVRHTAPIESRFFGLFLTEDNVQTFVMSTKPNVRLLIIRRILDQFSFTNGSNNDPSHLTVDQLGSIEEIWTGHSRLRTPFHLKEARVYAIYVAAYHLSPSWDQIRDLCVIAVTDRAFELLVTASELKTRKSKPLVESAGHDNSSDPFVDSSVVDYIARLRRVSFGQNLLACITRVCGRQSRKCYGVIEQLEPCDASIWALVSYIYKFHKKGDLEPDLPFLRLSASSDVQPTSFDFEPDPLSLNGLEELELSDDGAVLVYGGHHNYKKFPTLCVFIAREDTKPPSLDDLARTIKSTFEERDVYHTTRHNGTLNPRREKRERNIWNLCGSYGVFFSYGGRSFVKWLRALGKPLPTRQGSPRGPDEVGHKILFERRYTPWHDPRLIHGGTHAEMRKTFLRRLLTAEVAAWAGRARQLIREGERCCLLCAGEVEEIEEEDWDEMELYGDGDLDAGGGEDGEVALPTPNTRQNGDEGGGLISTAEPESDNEFERRLRHMLDNYSTISGVCWLCNDELGSDGRWKDWVKKVIRRALKKAMSANELQDAKAPGSPGNYDYRIATPPLRDWWRLLNPEYNGENDSDLSDSQPDGEDNATTNADGDCIRVSTELSPGPEIMEPEASRQEEETELASTSSRQEPWRKRQASVEALAGRKKRRQK